MTNRPRLHLKFSSEGQDMPAKSVVEKAMVETAAGVRPPDFERAIRVMRADINPAIEGMAEVRGEVSAAWKVIGDECRVNKAAARFVRVHLMGASEEKKDDVLRSLYGLMKVAGIAISADLVDRAMGGDAPTMPVARANGTHAPAPQNAKPEPRAPFDDGELDGVVEELPERGGLTAADVEAMDDGSKPIDFSKAKPFAGTHGSDLAAPKPRKPLAAVPSHH